MAKLFGINIRSLRYYDQKGLRPAGDAAEFALLDFGLTECQEDFITELQRPVTYK